VNEDNCVKECESTKLLEDMARVEKMAGDLYRERKALSIECARWQSVNGDVLRRRCSLTEGRAAPYPEKGKSGELDVDWHRSCVLM
jgi:hypothetical protein